MQEIRTSEQTDNKVRNPRLVVPVNGDSRAHSRSNCPSVPVRPFHSGAIFAHAAHLLRSPQAVRFNFEFNLVVVVVCHLSENERRNWPVFQGNDRSPSVNIISYWSKQRSERVFATHEVRTPDRKLGDVLGETLQFTAGNCST